MLWIKDGKLFDGKIEINGRVSFVSGEPDPELMRSLGYEEYVPPPPEPAPKRYSKLKIIDALGEAWEEKKAELEAAGIVYDKFTQATYLSMDYPEFAAIYNSLTAEEKQILDTECLYDN